MKIELTPITNRAADGKFSLPQDGWIQLAPRGEFPHLESGRVQVLDEAAITAMVNRFTEDAKKPGFAGLLIDHEHFSYDTEKSSESYGWIRELANRDNGLWGRVEWTPLGEQAVKGGVYRFISPVWLSNEVEVIANDRVRPLRLDTAGLTNCPNLRGMVPLTNRAGQPGSGTPNPNHETQRMKTVATALGLSADASEEAILAEVTKLQKKVTDAESASGAMTNRVTALDVELTAIKAEKKALLETQIEADLEQFKNRFAPEKRDQWKKALLANRADALALLGSIPEPKAEAETGAGKPMHNRDGTKQPAADAAKQGKEEARAKRIANRASQISKEQNVPYSQAWNMAKGEFPE